MDKVANKLKNKFRTKQPACQLVRIDNNYMLTTYNITLPWHYEAQQYDST